MEPGPGSEELWEASRLLYCLLLRSTRETLATLDRMAETVVSTAADCIAADLAGLTRAGLTRADLMVANGTVASLACPMVSAEGIASTGSMAGVTDVMAGGGCRVGMEFLSTSVVGLPS
jgi:hypothetical protein